MKYLLVIILIALSTPSFTQKILDDFESLNNWKKIASDEVEISPSLADGIKGKCIRIDFNFKTGTGYCGIEKILPIKLPENFKFSYYLRADAPVNNLEFKLLDKSGENVWWYDQRSYEFPSEWKKEIVKKRNIEFAWGPTEDKTLREMDKLEIFIASATGGKGTIYLDELTFEELEPLSAEKPTPVITYSSNTDENKNLLDGNNFTIWHSKNNTHQEIVIDLVKHSEYGGLIIDWDNDEYAEKYDIQISENNKNWETIYVINNGAGGRRYIDLRDNESRYIKLALKKSANKLFIIKDIAIKDFDFSDTPEKFFMYIAKDNPRGYYPRHLNNEQTFWTIVGVNNDFKEALINVDGMIELDARKFSIEPFIFYDGKFINWNNVKKSQNLEKDYLPIPSVSWKTEEVQLTIKTFADGEPEKSDLYIIYQLENNSGKNISGNLYLTQRPFQVNPAWQWLNNPGGTAKIKTINYDGNVVVVNDEKYIYPLPRPDAFGASQFDNGDITGFISADKIPAEQTIADDFGYGSSALRYAFNLNPGEKKLVALCIPFYGKEPHPSPFKHKDDYTAYLKNRLDEVSKFWEEKLNTVQFKLPESADHFINTIKSNLAYILINRDGYGIQPGSRSYERSWIRDGSLTGSALLKFGIKDEVKNFINWYSRYQFKNGKVPCVVDKRGPDPVPENDSHGELIFAILQYYNFTKDTSFLRNRFENVIKAVNYIDSISGLRRTDYYKNGNDSLKALYGLLPESISHEGYSAKPMHSYWDDFFGLKGLKDAVEIVRILGEKSYEEKFSKIRDEFRTNLYNSMKRSVKNHNINYIPGAAELGDFDATSTAIAIYPCNEYKNLPEPYLHNTFNKYYENFTKRLDPSYNWDAYTPYEVRVIGTFIYLNEIERAHELIKFFFEDQLPKAWNHWAEVVYKDSTKAKFIGDMPHTWVGSDFISAARSMFIYENELDRSLVIGAGLYDDWINSPEGMSITNLPTYHGNISYSIKKTGNKYTVDLTGDLKMPDGNIRIKNHGGKVPSGVLVNGASISEYNKDEIVVKFFPAKVEIIYSSE